MAINDKKHTRTPCLGSEYTQSWINLCQAVRLSEQVKVGRDAPVVVIDGMRSDAAILTAHYTAQAIVICLGNNQANPSLEKQLLSAGATTYLNIDTTAPADLDQMVTMAIAAHSKGAAQGTAQPDLSDVVAALLTHENPLEGLGAVAESLRSLTGCACIMLELYRQDGVWNELHAIMPGSSYLNLINRFQASGREKHSAEIYYDKPPFPDSDGQFSQFVRMQHLRSTMSLPLSHQGNPIGRLIFAWRTEYGYEGCSLSRIQQFATALTLALLPRQPTHNSQQPVQLVTQSIEALSAGSDLAAILQNTVNYIESTFDISVCEVRLAEMATADESSIGRRIAPYFALESDAGFASTVNTFTNMATNRKRYVLASEPNVLHVATAQRYIMRSELIGSLVIIPIVFQEEVIGTINVATASDKPAITNEDATILQAVANQLAFAVQNAKLYQQAVRSTQHLESLFETTHALVTLNGMEPMLQKMLDDMVALLDADSGVFYTLDFENEKVLSVVHAQRNRLHRSDQDFSYKDLMGSLTGWAIRERKPILSNSNGIDPRETPRTQKSRAQGNAGCLLIVPMYFQDEPIGTLTLARMRGRPEFTVRDGELITSVAEVAAAGVRTSGLIDEYSINLNRTEVLLNTAQAIINASDLQSLLCSITDSLAEELRSHICTAVLLDVEEKQVVEIAENTTWREMNRLPPLTYEDLNNGLTGHVFKTRHPIMSSGKVGDPRESAEVQQRRHESGIGSVMIAPFVYEKKIIGTLTVCRPKGALDFIPDDLELLVATANLVAVAIHNIRLKEQMQASLVRNQTLLDATHALITAKSSSELMQEVIDLLMVAFKAHGGGYLILDVANERVISGGQDSYSRSSLNTNESRSANYSYSELMDGVTKHVIIDKKPQLSPGGIRDKREKMYVWERRKREQVGCIMIAPILNQGIVWGTMAIGRKIGEPDFTEEDLATFAAVANQMSFALINVKTFEDTKIRVDTLAQRVDRRNKALALKNTELKTANRRLLELDQMKDKFVADMSHELRTPISSIKLYLSLLARGKESRHEHYMQVLNTETDRLERMIADTLRLTRLDLGKVRLELMSVDLHQLIQAELGVYQPQIAEAGLNVEVSLQASLSIMMGESVQLSEMIGILLKNAINYTASGTIAIETAADPAGQHVIMRVRDSGRGIPRDATSKIFGRFYRGSNANDIPGAGLGLSIAQEIIKLHHGSITVTSEIDTGTTVEVRLPYDLSSKQVSESG